MIIASRNIQYALGDTIRIKPIFDVHLRNAFCDERAFVRYLQENDTPQTYFIGGGDLMDSIVTTDKRYQKSSDGTNGDAIIDEQVDTAYDILLPYKDRILGLGTGNHEQVITKKCGTDPTRRLCSQLNVPYLGYSCLYRLNLRMNDGHGRSVVIRQHHGWGGGSRTRGGSITVFERDLGHWDADIYLYGHVHKKQFDRTERLGLSGTTLIAKPMLMCICGTYLKTFSNTADASYSEIKGYPPVEIGGLTICIKPNSRRYDLWVEM